MPTFLFTDIEGSTRLWEKHPEAMAAALRKHDSILQRLIPLHGGRLIKHTGDGVFAVFDEEGEDGAPLECAIRILIGLSEEDWGEVGSLLVRLAVHSGDADKRGDDYFGTAVSRTARLLDAGWGGQILITDEARVSGVLPEGASLFDHGDHLLKDLSEPAHVLSMSHPAIPTRDFPPLRTLNARPHNLPQQPTAFIGRRMELDRIDELLSEPECRLLTLLGQGGIGKTRVGLQAAAERIEEYPDGVFFVALAPISSADYLVQTIIDALGLVFYSSEDQKLLLFDHLQKRKMLIVMDNFEHVAAGAGLLSEILSVAPDVNFLVTSRQRLNLRCEWLFPISGMRFTDAGEIDDVSHDSALLLFESAARKLVPGFKAEGAVRDKVVDICRLVDGMPLALELAASWLRVLTLPEIAGEIGESLDFLESRMADMPGRHRSLGQVFEYSWNLLEMPEQEALSGLSVFRGGFDRKAAKAVAGAGLSLIAALSDRSLLTRMSDDRFSIHEVTRQYAEEKLRSDTERDASVRSAHSRHYMNLLAEKEHLLGTYRRVDIVDGLSEDIENIRAAWFRAADDGRRDDIAAAAPGLYVFCCMKGWFRDGRIMLQTALEKLLISSGEQKPESDAVLTAILPRLGWLHFLTGDMDLAEADLRWCLKLCVRTDDLNTESRVLSRLSALAMFRGNLDRAFELAERSICKGKQSGVSFSVAMALNNQANILRKSGQYTRAVEVYSESLSISIEDGDLYGKGVVLGNLGICHYRLGNLDTAKRLTMESIDLAETMGDLRLIAEGKGDLSNIVRTMGDFDRAKELLEECLYQNRKLGLRSAVATSLGNLAFLAVQQGEYVEAERIYDEAREISKKLDRPFMVIDCLCGKCDIALKRNDVDSAIPLFVEALEMARNLPLTSSSMHLLASLAEVFSGRRETERALDLLAFILENAGDSASIVKFTMKTVSKLDPQPAPEEITAARERVKNNEFRAIADELLQILYSGSSSDAV